MQRELNLDLEEAASQASWSLIGQVSCALDWVKTFVFWEGGVSRLGIYRMQGRIDAGEGKKKVILHRSMFLSILRCWL